jgi:hypothetical protein
MSNVNAMSREKAMKAANLIADDFTVGFCDHRMVENVAGRIEEVYNDLAGQMTLRDHFAAKAMQGFCAHDDWAYLGHLAASAYRLADEMLKAREIK